MRLSGWGGRAAADEHEDLFWALRGAGRGNFGVVVGTPTDASTVLSGYTDRTGPPSSTSCTELSTVESARHCAYPGDAAEHELPVLPPDGRRPALRVARSEFFTTPMPRSALTEVAEHLVTARRYGVYRDLELIPWGGALSAPAGGAFAHRSARFLVKHTVQTGSNASEELRTQATEWVNHSWSLTHSYGTGGAYPNYPDLALPNWAHAYHGPHLPRLREIKRKYDPNAVFHFSQGL